MTTEIDIGSLDSFRDFLCQEIQRIATVDSIEIEEYVAGRLAEETSAIARRKLAEVQNAAAEKGRELTPEYAEVVTYLALKTIFLAEEVGYVIGSTKFPDITVGNSGFEVKTISSGKVVLGNSVLQEGSGLDHIFAVSFYAEVANVKVTRYEDLIAAIKVDHNPRFLLSGESEFDFQGRFGLTLEEYLSLSLEEKSRMVRKYLKGELADGDIKWYLPEGKLPEDEVLSIQLILKLNDERKPKGEKDKDKVRAKVFARRFDLFARADYGELRAYVLEQFGFFGGVKDMFTAGGIGKEEEIMGFPRLYCHFILLLPEIRDYLLESDEDLDEWKEASSRQILARIDKRRNGLTLGQAGKIIRLISELGDDDAGADDDGDDA